MCVVYVYILCIWGGATCLYVCVCDICIEVCLCKCENDETQRCRIWSRVLGRCGGPGSAPLRPRGQAPPTWAADVPAGPGSDGRGERRRWGESEVRVTRWVKLESPRDLAAARPPPHTPQPRRPPPHPAAWIISIRDYKRACGVSLKGPEPEIDSTSRRKLDRLQFHASVSIPGVEPPTQCCHSTCWCHGGR